MAQNFLTAEQVKVKLAGELGVEPARLTAGRWNEIIYRETNVAKNKILEKLFARGFTLAQLYTWDALEDYHTKQSLYGCLIAGATGKLHSIQIEIIDRYNVADELDSLALISGDTTLVPADETAGGAVSAGNLDTTNDTYTRDTEW